MKISIKVLLVCVPLTCLAVLHACKKEDVSPFELTSILANGLDLNGSSLPTGVEINAVILATFTADIDPGSILRGSITMTRNYDTANVPLTVIISKKTLTIKSIGDLLSGARYTITITSSLRSSQGSPFRSFAREFKTIGTFVPANQKAYWNFDDVPDDILGNYDPVSSEDAIIGYADSKNTASLMAASFDGKTSIVQVPGGTSLLTPEFTITFWMYLNSDNHVDASGNPKGSYVLGIGNVHGLEFEVHPNYDWCKFSHGLLLTDNTTTVTDFQYYANGRTRDNLDGQPDSVIRGIDNATTVSQDLSPGGLKSRLDKVWAQVAFIFDDSTKTRSLFINGELMYRQDLGLLDTTTVLPAIRPLVKAKGLKFIPDTSFPATYDDKLAFGFWQSKSGTFGGAQGTYGQADANHFQGKLDDIRIFNRALTDLEIWYMYNDEKP